MLFEVIGARCVYVHRPYISCKKLAKTNLRLRVLSHVIVAYTCVSLLLAMRTAGELRVTAV